MRAVRRLAGAGVCVAASVVWFANPSGAVIHEITAAYCSVGGGGAFVGLELVPPGVAKDPAFARPVLASGAVSVPDLLTTDAPQVKVQSGLFAPTFELTSETIDHPSEHCAALSP